MTPDQKKVLRHIKKSKRKNFGVILKSRITDKSPHTVDSVLWGRQWNSNIVKEALAIIEMSDAEFDQAYIAAVEMKKQTSK